MLLSYTAAYATSNIDIAVADSDPGAIRWLWLDQDMRMIGCMGYEEFAISISESSPYDIDTCWIYLDGVTTTGTTRNVTANSYRNLNGVVVIKYSNATYESEEFRVLPAWELSCPNLPSPGSKAPTSFQLPSDMTAASMILAVAQTELDGPTGHEDHLDCDNESCEPFVNVDKDRCKTDMDCIDEW